MPVIAKTTRLYLRELTTEDAIHFFAMNSDPEVLRYTGDDPFESVNAARTFLARYVKQYKTHGMGRWAICLNTNDVVLGWCGLKYRPENDVVDVGYRLYKKYWGQGYATEATKAAINYGFKTLELDTIVAHVHVENLASQRVALKAGMHYVKDFIYDGEPSQLYQINNPASTR